MITADHQEFQMKDLLTQFAPSSEQPIRFLNYDSRILIWNLSQWIPPTPILFRSRDYHWAYAIIVILFIGHVTEKKIHSVSFSCYIILSASILEDSNFEKKEPHFWNRFYFNI